MPVLRKHGKSKVVLVSCVGGAVLATFGVLAPAWAQDKQDTRREQSGAKVTVAQENEKQDKGASDADMVSDDYQPKGVEVGQFLFLPKLELGEQYNSNIYALHSDKKHDLITVIRPEAKLRSRFVEHALNFGLLVEDYRYARFTDDNRTDFSGYVDGRYDFSGDTTANQFSQLSWGHEDRGSPDAVNGKEPTATFSSTNRTGVEHKEGRFKFLGEVGYDRKEFGEAVTSAGTTVDNSDRDRWEFQLRERASYEMFPGYSALVELSENTRRYDMSVDRNGYDRSSSGYRAEAGIGVDISKLIRGDFLVGYMQQNYRDRELRDPSGLAMKASFSWTPTKMTNIMPSLERSLMDTTTARASAMIHNSGTLTIKHELARNIILTGFGSASYDELDGVSGQNFWTYEGGATALYSFMPELYVSGELKYRDKEADVELSSYSQTTMMVRLGFQY